jgi:streptomycin 3"-adenylyltransferase
MKSSKRPLEITLVVQSAINPWYYPPLFDFQYGEWLRESFEMGNIEPWTNYTMPDLAIIITQVLLKSHTLLGLPPEQTVDHIPYNDFIKAMLSDLERLADDLMNDTRNVLLTYARIWSTLETNEIRSKPDAADWTLKRLPPLYQPVMNRASQICVGDKEEYWDDLNDLIEPCADFMAGKIDSLKLRCHQDDDLNEIKLAL